MKASAMRPREVVRTRRERTAEAACSRFRGDVRLHLRSTWRPTATPRNDASLSWVHDVRRARKATHDQTRCSMTPQETRAHVDSDHERQWHANPSLPRFVGGTVRLPRASTDARRTSPLPKAAREIAPVTMGAYGTHLAKPNPCHVSTSMSTEAVERAWRSSTGAFRHPLFNHPLLEQSLLSQPPFL